MISHCWAVLGMIALIPNLTEGCALNKQNDLQQLDWLTGQWCAKGETSTTNEWWLPHTDGMMVGVNLASRPGKSPVYEYLRIEQTKDGVEYIASPFGKKEVRFKATACGDSWIVFENPNHDWPTKITYRLEAPNRLRATAEGPADEPSNALSWLFVKQTSSGRN